MPKDRICKHLEDVCATAPAGSGLASKFDNAYAVVANQFGVKPAPRDELNKSFGPSTWGIVLGGCITQSTGHGQSHKTG